MFKLQSISNTRRLQSNPKSPTLKNVKKSTTTQENPQKQTTQGNLLSPRKYHASQKPTPMTLKQFKFPQTSRRLSDYTQFMQERDKKFKTLEIIQQDPVQR